jgi:hypothetical protein
VLRPLAFSVITATEFEADGRDGIKLAIRKKALFDLAYVSAVTTVTQCTELELPWVSVERSAPSTACHARVGP